MPVTIKDIARQACVSHSTVSRALNGSPLIPKATAEHIRQTALKLGYLPSAAARTLKTNRSRALGVIIRSVDDPFFSEILQGIEAVAQDTGYSLFMAASSEEREQEKNILQAMVARRVDGIIICSTQVSVEESRYLSRFGVPVVVINNQSAEVYRYSIYHDDVDGGRQVTRHLIELGHRRIAYLGNSVSGRSTHDRLSGFEQELKAAGIVIPPEYILQVPGGRPENGVADLERILEIPERPTALVCYNDMMAIGVLHGLHARGIRVPGQMSVTGFDNILFSAFTNPPLTTFDQPKHYIGSEAARLVLDLANQPDGKDDTPQPHFRKLKGSLLVRSSTAPPAALPE